VATTVYGDTDSLFINFKVRNPTSGELLKGKEAIEATMALTEEAGKFVTRCLKRPHDFEYDKVFYPFIIFSKKRYVGNKFEDSSVNYKQTSMGIATKRRDYAGIVKNVYGGAIKILLTEANIQKAYDFVQKVCTDLVDGKISDHQLTLTKSLRAEYKTATPPAHKALADRIALRDPGNAPSSGERMQFMYILPPIGQIESKLQGDRIETPSFIKENNLKIDYKYYIQHQIYNPICQLFALFVDQLPGYVKPSHNMTIEEKEDYAGKLLFNSIYAKCDKVHVRNFADKFNFKVLNTEKPIKQTKLQPIIEAAKPKKKGEVNTMKMDMYLIKKIDEKKDKKDNNDKKKSEKMLVVEA
jgi:DNA polymerase elongation subunit (family B)